MERKLNLDIAGSVSELETLLKKVLPKNIIYRILLGRGLDFDGYRDFTQDDDAILIDWKASVRSKKLLTKKYIEERDLKFVLIVDVSDNMVFGSTEKLKCEYTAELSAAVSHLMLMTGDKVGFVLFNGKVIKMRPPELGTRPFDIFSSYLSDPLLYGGDSNLDKILDYLLGVLDRDVSMVFIISDFINVDESYKKSLEMFAGMFETTAIIVRDPLDSSLPAINKEVVIESIETGERMIVNPKVVKSIYEQNAIYQLNLTKTIFQNLNIDFLELSTDKSFAGEFALFLKERMMGGRKVRLKNVY